VWLRSPTQYPWAWLCSQTQIYFLFIVWKINLNQRKEQKIPDPISLGVVAEPDPISLGMTVQPNPNLFPLYCMKNKFKSEKRAKNPRPNILGCGRGARPNILRHGCAARPNTFLKCFGSGWPTTPNAITPFESVLGLAVKLEPATFDKESNTPRHAGCRSACLGLQSGAPVWP